MAQSFHLFDGEPTVTSSPTEVRVWIEELDYSFLAYGENFERAEINGEKLLNITRQKLTELGVTQTEHQDIILKAVADINKKTKLEEQAMQGEDKINKMLPTRFRKQSEILEQALNQLLDGISERRRERILYGSIEDPPYHIFAAALELINVVEMILNILERAPVECMSEFSSLKNNIIKHITLLKNYSEQSELNNEMESEMIDLSKNVTKMCYYIISLPPEITGPEELTPNAQVPVAIECKAATFSFEHGSDYEHTTRCLSMPVTAKSSSTEHVLPLQDMSPQNKIVPNRSEYGSPETLNSPSHKDEIMMPRDEDKSETEVSDTKCSDTSPGSLNYKILQDLLIIENVSPLPDSGSEICEIDSDSDRGIGLDYDLEQWKDTDSVIWGMDSDSEIYPIPSGSVKHLLEAERYPRASGSVKDPMQSEQHLLEVEQFQADYDSLKNWGDSDSEKCLEYSDSEKCLVDSDNERPEIDSDSEKCSIASVSVKHLQKAEKFQMTSDSIKRMLDSEKRSMDIKQQCIVSESEEYVMDSSMETDKIGSASASGVHPIGKEKYQKKTRSRRYRMDSDSEPCEVDSDSERHALATMAAKCLVGTKTYQLSTDTEGHRMDFLSERHTMDFDSESLGRASDSVKHMMKAKRCQSKRKLERSWMDLKRESEKSLTDSVRQQLDFDYDDRYRDSSRRYQHRSARFQGGSERCQLDFDKEWDNFERHQLDSDSKKHPANSENEKSDEFESERHMMEREEEQCLIQSENTGLQLDKEQENYGIDSDREKEQQIIPDNERQHVDSENEAQRLGARKKDNRPPGFWRPVFLSPPFGPAKKTEEKQSVQQTDSKEGCSSEVPLLLHFQ